MLRSLFRKVFGTKNDRELKRMRPIVAHINELEPQFEKLDDEQLAAKTDEFKSRLKNGESLDDLLPEAYATVREASKRVLGMRHYDVQLIGGIVLHRGSIAEMKTGEGKTLTATLPLYLNALEEKGAHLITVNDYLAARDAEWMGEVYHFLGMTTGTIVPNLSPAQRKEAYDADITYGTNNEFGFDYLRDNMKYDLSKQVQRPLNYGIIDEVDSILIDEARTPLIISGQAEQSSELYMRVDDVIAYLIRDEDFIVDEEHRSVSLTDQGTNKVEEKLGIDNLYEPTNLQTLHHVNKALQAHVLYKRDEQYLVRNNKVVIIDEFTGRAMEGRRWSDGLHQAVEAKEGLPIQNESVTMATVTYQNFFRMYDKLSGMTGTAATEEEEFQEIYDLSVFVIPTNEPVIRKDQPDVVYRTEGEKFTAIVDQIEECHEKGQPVLVGTINVDKSEVISKVLRKKKIPHSVLNAKQHGKEANIVAQAGRKGAVTIATNMAGRGTDIVLGGNPKELAEKVSDDPDSDKYQNALENFKEVCAKERQEVLDAGGLFILGTERHDSRRIDNQLRGRAGRQGDPGESRFFLSLEDELMRRFGADRIQNLMGRLGMEEGVPIEAGMVSKSIENAQRRVEGRNFDIRKNLLKYDEVLDSQRSATYELRDQILRGEGIEELILDALSESLEGILDMYCNRGMRVDDWDFEALARSFKELFAVEIDPEELPENRDTLEQELWGTVEERYQDRIDQMTEIAQRYNERFADDADFEEKTAKDVFLDVARESYLRELDKNYRDHLQAMKYLRDSVGLHAHAQKDPKHIYQKEGFSLYEQMQADVNASVSKYVMRLVVKSEESVQAATKLGRSQTATASSTQSGGSASSRQAPRRISVGGTSQRASQKSTTQDTQQQARSVPKVGRNDPCWCGSGDKYKHCHMRKDREAHERERKKALRAARSGGDSDGSEKGDDDKQGVSIL
jgi:preprotein translocase subunit SecA